MIISSSFLHFYSLQCRISCSSDYHVDIFKLCIFFISKLINALCLATVKLLRGAFGGILLCGNHLLIVILHLFVFFSFLPFSQSLVLNFQKLRMRLNSFCSAEAHPKCENVLLCIVEVYNMYVSGIQRSVQSHTLVKFLKRNVCSFIVKKLVSRFPLLSGCHDQVVGL